MTKPNPPKSVSTTIRQLIDQLTDRLAAAGFNPQYSKTMDRGRWYLTWYRDCAWKRESILLLNRSRLGLHSISLAVNIELKYEDKILNQPYTLLDSVSFSRALAKDGSYESNLYSINSLLAKLSARSRATYCGRVVADTERVLDYFERFSTPEHCLDYVTKSRCSIGEHGSRREQEALAFLDLIIQRNQSVDPS